MGALDAQFLQGFLFNYEEAKCLRRCFGFGENRFTSKDVATWRSLFESRSFSFWSIHCLIFMFPLSVPPWFCGVLPYQALLRFCILFALFCSCFRWSALLHFSTAIALFVFIFAVVRFALVLLCCQVCLYFATICCTLPCFSVLCYALPCLAVLCFALSYSVLLFSAPSCFVRRRRAVSCCAVLQFFFFCDVRGSRSLRCPVLLYIYSFCALSVISPRCSDGLSSVYPCLLRSFSFYYSMVAEKGWFDAESILAFSPETELLYLFQSKTTCSWI